MLAPIAPHFSEYIWLELLKKPETIQNALWPKVPDTVPALTAAREYVKVTSSSITSAEGTQIKKLAKGKNVDFDPNKSAYQNHDHCLPRYADFKPQTRRLQSMSPPPSLAGKNPSSKPFAPPSTASPST